MPCHNLFVAGFPICYFKEKKSRYEMKLNISSLLLFLHCSCTPPSGIHFLRHPIYKKDDKYVDKTGFRIRNDLMRIWIWVRNQHFFKFRIQDYNDKNWKEFAAEKKEKKNFGSKIAIYLSLGLHKDAQDTEEAFRPQKRTPSTSKHEFS